MDMSHLHVSSFWFFLVFLIEKDSFQVLGNGSTIISKHNFNYLLFLAGSRWRRVPVEYASTSEDEYGSNRHISKQSHTRPFPSTRVAQLGGSAPASPSPTGLTPLKQHSREQDEYMRDWTAHSEEIARYVGERCSSAV